MPLGTTRKGKHKLRIVTSFDTDLAIGIAFAASRTIRTYIKEGEIILLRSSAIPS